MVQEVRMTKDEALLRAVTAIQMRQKPSGAWEYYGPRADPDFGTNQASRTGLMVRRAMIALQFIGLEEGTGHWYAAKNEVNRRFHRKGRPKDLEQLLDDTLEFLKGRGLCLQPEEEVAHEN
jgi:hypothetical protein